MASLMPGSPDTPSPTSRARFALAGVAVWALVVLGFGSQTYAMYAVKRESVPFGRALVWAFNDWFPWLLLAPLVLWLARRYPIERPWVRSHLALHLFMGLLIGVVHGVGYYGMEWLTNELDQYANDQVQVALVYATKGIVLGLLVYGTLVGLSHGLTYYRRYQDRERRTIQLSAQLSRAELEVLKMQLQPHFLFNTLHAISALVRSDPEAADRIITRLGDLLRMSLTSNGAQEVALRQELEFVEKYADIQRTRFRDRLTIRIEADPEALDAMVPSLILQPLVENSIRHGVERREEAAVIDVRARCRGDRLILTVIDDGPGFPDDVLTPVPGRGLGLSNTRARLWALYGEAGKLEVGTAPNGGAVVTLDLPFRRATHAA